MNDPASGYCFYTNAVTGSSQWEAPPQLSSLWEGPGASAASGPASLLLHGKGMQAMSTMSGEPTADRVAGYVVVYRNTDSGPTPFALTQ